MDISIAEAHNRLSALLKLVEKEPIRIQRRGKTVGVLVSPALYEKLRRVEAYLQLLEVAQQVADRPSADEIYQASREELEARS